MSDKKGGFFSKLKDKVLKKKDDDDLYEEDEYEYEDYEEDELDDQLETRTEDVGEEEDEVFEAQEMAVSKSPDKTDEINVENLKEQLDEVEYEEDDFDEASDVHNYNEFEVPKTKGKSSLTGFFSKKKGQLSLAKKINFSWDDFINAIFSPDTRKTIHKIFLASLFCVFTYVVGKSLALMLQGQDKSAKVAAASQKLPPLPNSRQDIARIQTADLFNTAQEKRAPGVKATPKPTPKVPNIKFCHKANKASTIPLKLIGTLVLQDSVKSLAAVQVRGKKKLINLREGQKVDNLAEIGRISDQKVTFKNLKTGLCEYIRSSKKKSGKPPHEAVAVVSKKKAKQIVKNQRKDDRIENVGNKFKIKKSLRDEMLGNIGEILTQAKAIPIKNPDGTLSFKITEIVAGSIFSKLNIQNGDIINQINGKTIQNVNEVMSMFGTIKERDNFQLSVSRNGSEESMEYKFE